MADIVSNSGSKPDFSPEQLQDISFEGEGLEKRILDFQEDSTPGAFCLIKGTSFFDAIQAMQEIKDLFGMGFLAKPELGLYTPDWRKQDKLFLVKGDNEKIRFTAALVYPPTGEAATAHTHSESKFMVHLMPGEDDVQGFKEGAHFIFNQGGLSRFSARKEILSSGIYLMESFLDPTPVIWIIKRGYREDYCPDLFPLMLANAAHMVFCAGPSGNGEAFSPGSHLATCLPRYAIDILRQEKGDEFLFQKGICSRDQMEQLFYSKQKIPELIDAGSFQFQDYQNSVGIRNPSQNLIQNGKPRI